MDIITSFISEYGNTILYAIFTAVAAFFATKIKGIYTKIETDRTKKAVVETCVKAVEQIYKDLHGDEKLAKACENISEMLAEKGISITDLEMRLLIEACVSEFNYNFKKEEKSNG